MRTEYVTDDDGNRYEHGYTLTVEYTIKEANIDDKTVKIVAGRSMTIHRGEIHELHRELTALNTLDELEYESFGLTRKEDS